MVFLYEAMTTLICDDGNDVFSMSSVKWNSSRVRSTGMMAWGRAVLGIKSTLDWTRMSEELSTGSTVANVTVKSQTKRH